MGLFSRKSDSDNAAEAILTLDLSHSPTAREQAKEHLRSAPTDALRDAISQLPDSDGRRDAEHVVRHADYAASRERLHRETGERRSNWGKQFNR